MSNAKDNAASAPFHVQKFKLGSDPNSHMSANEQRLACPKQSFKVVSLEGSTPKVRARSQAFADHYRYVRQVFIRTEAEQRHMRDALAFELSQVETPIMRQRLVAHLRTIDEPLAQDVAERLGIVPLSHATRPARRRTDWLRSAESPPTSPRKSLLAQ